MQDVMKTITRLKNEGVAVLVIEQNVQSALARWRPPSDLSPDGDLAIGEPCRTTPDRIAWVRPIR